MVMWPSYWANPSEARLAKMVKSKIYGPAATPEGIAADMAVEVLSGAGHLYMTGRSKEANEDVLSFVSAHSSAAQQ